MLFFVKLFIKLFFLHFKTLNASLLFSIQSWFKIQPQRNEEVGTFKWSINSNHPDPVACSPSLLWKVDQEMAHILCEKGRQFRVWSRIRIRSQPHSFGIKVISGVETGALLTKTAHKFIWSRISQLHGTCTWDILIISKKTKGYFSLVCPYSISLSSTHRPVSLNVHNTNSEIGEAINLHLGIDRW